MRCSSGADLTPPEIGPPGYEGPDRPARAGGLGEATPAHLKEPETENARLKRIVADKELQIQALKELGWGNW
jgi:putative transposase